MDLDHDLGTGLDPGDMRGGRGWGVTTSGTLQQN